MSIEIELKDVTKEYLDQSGIHDVREYARTVGVHAPAGMKKQELIDSILGIKEGKIKPIFPDKIGRGRPPKKPPVPVRETAEQEQAETPQIKYRVYVPENPPQRKGNGYRYGLSNERADKRSDPNNYPFADVERNGFSPKKKAEEELQEPAKQEPFDRRSEPEIRSGILEVLQDGYGFLRANNYRNSSKDSYIAAQKIKRYGLRAGDLIKAICRTAAEGKPPAVEEVTEVNGKPADQAFNRPKFDELTPIFPTERLRLELAGRRNELALRAIDLIAPIGKGQRAMVVSPPKAGKTTLLKMIAHSITQNSPEVKLMVLLIDERPEEVTDMQRSISGEVVYSTFDEECDNHIKVADLVLNRAKRLVEMGEDVVILLDSLTRMARANNVIVPSSGKTLSGGVDPVSLYFPKRFFGAARNIENGGSLTVIATALVDTGSRMDDVVYEEFKGTGNMEIHLDRRLAEKRIFPAIDLNRSGTRREELLLTQKELEGAYLIRKLLSAGDNQEAAESIINLMQKTPNNEELIKQLNLQVLAMQKDGYRMS
ncbi:MAG: transcription termination factor Rho [Clostridia bacterium]|nr:transcription termination factor Rho [Clostridia bacterium]